MQTSQIQDLVVDALDELKAQDIRCLNVQGKTSITDCMVIATGTSKRHVKSLADQVIEKAKAQGLNPRGAEGHNDSEWVLIDLIDVVVHVMTQNSRQFYDLERLWGEPEVVPRNDEQQR